MSQWFSQISQMIADLRRQLSFPQPPCNPLPLASLNHPSIPSFSSLSRFVGGEEDHTCCYDSPFAFLISDILNLISTHAPLDPLLLKAVPICRGRGRSHSLSGPAYRISYIRYLKCYMSQRLTGLWPLDLLPFTFVQAAAGVAFQFSTIHLFIP